MHNFKLQIEYAGTHYYGWQVQNGKRRDYQSTKTIQHILEQVLSKVLQEKIKLTVAGRTDAGVHALGQVANFKSNTKIPLLRLRWALNCLLPQDIKITRIQKISPSFNSRFSAQSKIYRYTILNRKYSSALLASQVYFFHYPLDLKLMKSEAKALLGRHNFSAFQAKDSRIRNPRRTIKSIRIVKKNSYINIDICADSFLYNMVRNIAGTLLEIGRGKLGKGSMAKILKSQERKFAGPTLPAKGLCLMRVNY